MSESTSLNRQRKIRRAMSITFGAITIVSLFFAIEYLMQGDTAKAAGVVVLLLDALLLCFLGLCLSEATRFGVEDHKWQAKLTWIAFCLALGALLSYVTWNGFARQLNHTYVWPLLNSLF